MNIALDETDIVLLKTYVYLIFHYIKYIKLFSFILFHFLIFLFKKIKFFYDKRDKVHMLKN